MFDIHQLAFLAISLFRFRNAHVIITSTSVSASSFMIVSGAESLE